MLFAGAGLLVRSRRSCCGKHERKGRRFCARPGRRQPGSRHTRRVTPSEGVHYKPSAAAHEKGPLNFEAFSGPKFAREVGRCRRLLQGPARRNATRKRSGGLAFGGLIGVLLRLEDDPLVEFGKGELDVDLRQGENGVGDQDFVRPCLAGAGVDGGADAVLFEHDVALHGWAWPDTRGL